MRYGLLALGGILWIFSACNVSKKTYRAEAEDIIAQASAERPGLAQLGERIRSARPELQFALTEALLPHKSLYDSLFVNPYSLRLYRFHRQIRRLYFLRIRPKSPRQKLVRVWRTTPDSLSANAGEATYFPGGYREIASWFSRGDYLYRLEFFDPDGGKAEGFDVFVWLNGRWYLFPKPWATTDDILGY